MQIVTIEYKGKIVDAYKYNPTGYRSDLYYKVFHCGTLNLPPFIHHTDARELNPTVENNSSTVKYS